MALTFVGDPLAAPEICLGIPFGDSNTQTPDPTWGVPVPGWALGGLTIGHIYGAHYYHRFANFIESEWVANPFGVGRSLFVETQADMDGLPAALGGTGSGNSFILTPPSHYGYLPVVGSSQTVKFRLLLVLNLNLGANHALHVSLSQYRDNDVFEDQDVLKTFTVADNTGGEYLSFASDHVITKNALTRYLRLAFWPEADGSAQGFSIDFFGLGFIPQNDGFESGAPSFTDDYVGDGLGCEYAVEVEDVRPTGGYGHWIYNRGHNLKRVSRLSMQFYRATAQWRQDLLWFWAAQNGIVSVGDRIKSGRGNELGGRPWPLLLRPRHPHFKQAMYCRLRATPFFLDVDTGPKFVEPVPTYSGLAELEELIF
jgi:hypothetical protein